MGRYDFLVDTYRTERHKTLSVWSQIPDARMRDRSEPRARLKDRELDRARALISALQAALKPLESLSPSRPYDFAEIASRHRTVSLSFGRSRRGARVRPASRRP